MKRKRPSTSAFSLVEVLVASAVLSVVMAILLGTLSTSMSLWRNTENKIAADREGRAGEVLIAQDLANALVPNSMNLWPRVTNSGGITFLRFLTTRPPDYQSANGNNVGDVCFVEYFFSPDNAALFRVFRPSGWTFTNVIKPGSFPAASTNDSQLLSTNLLADVRDAVRGVSQDKLGNEMSTNTFIVLASTNLLPYPPGGYTADNPPLAIEVNFAAADPEAIANKDLLSNENYKLRNAGFYSFRVSLPKPQDSP